jgi:methionyl-tRNA formyltransferase
VKLLDAERIDAAGGGAPGGAAKLAGRGLAVSCGAGTTLLVTRLQPEGKGAQDALAFLNGLRRDALAFGT